MNIQPACKTRRYPPGSFQEGPPDPGNSGAAKVATQSAHAHAAASAAVFRTPLAHAWSNAGNTAYLGAHFSIAAASLAYASGLGTGAIAGAAAAGAACAGATGLLHARFAADGREGASAALQHVVYNGCHTLAGGLFGMLPMVSALTAAFSALASHPDTKGLMELGPVQFCALSAVTALPAACLLSSLASALAGSAAITGTAPSDVPHAGSAVDDPAAAKPAVSPGWKIALNVASPLLPAWVLMATPAVVLYASGSSETAIRYSILMCGHAAGAWVREVLNQATAPAWVAIKRNGEGWQYGLDGVPPELKYASTLIPTAISSLAFGVSSALLLHFSEPMMLAPLVPPGMSILAVAPAELAGKLALRALLFSSTNEMFEGLARCAGLGFFSCAEGIPLRYNHADALGLPQAPREFAKHCARSASHQKAAVFAALRAFDGSVVILLTQLARDRKTPPGLGAFYMVLAIAAQASTMARTPLVAAWLLPSLHPAGTTVMPAILLMQSDSETIEVSDTESVLSQEFHGSRLSEEQSYL